MTLLFSFAHPDDESFSGAGLACWCAERHADVVLACATRGEAGRSGRVEVSGAPADVGVAREAELREAAHIVGIRWLHLLGYRDRELEKAPPEEIRGKLVTIIRQHRPDVVVTFDPNGFNLHPDHVAISRFTSDAIAAAADPRWIPAAGTAHRVRRLVWTPPLAPWDAVASPDVAAEPGVDFVIDVARWRTQKAAALHAHRTQHESVERHFLNRPDVDRILSRELYRHAWGPPLAASPSGDIFEGLAA